MHSLRYFRHSIKNYCLLQSKVHIVTTTDNWLLHFVYFFFCVGYDDSFNNSMGGRELCAFNDTYINDVRMISLSDDGFQGVPEVWSLFVLCSELAFSLSLTPTLVSPHGIAFFLIVTPYRLVHVYSRSTPTQGGSNCATTAICSISSREMSYVNN